MQTNTLSVETSGNVVTGNAVECGFDPEAFGTIMNILSNMYSNRNLAVLREYSCNAYDEHVASGQSLPIEVTLPTALQPTLLVRDYGRGLSKEAVIGVYGRYGTSTKRDSNDQIGGFGIGSKAAFTLGQQFVVTSVKDGVKVVVLFALNTHNVGTMNVISEGPTDEPSGTLISLAVEDIDVMREEADKFFSGWSKGTVLVDGHEPASLFDRATEVHDNTYLVPDYDGAVLLRMGQVTYPVSNHILSKVSNRLFAKGAHEAAQTVNTLTGWHNSSALLIDAPIGSAEIAPSREALMDSEQTILALVDLMESLGSSLVERVQEKVSEASSAIEAVRVLNTTLEDLLPLQVKRADITYRSIPLPEQVEVEVPALVLGSKSGRSTTKVVKVRDRLLVKADEVDKFVVVKGVPEKSHGAVKRFAKRFIEGTEYSTILLPEPDADWGVVDWFSWGTESGVKAITHEEYKATLKALRASAPKDKNEPSYSLNTWRYDRAPEDRTPLSEIIDEGKDVLVYVENVNLSSMEHEVIKAEGWNYLVLMPTQSEKVLRQRLEDDGTIEVIEHSTLAEKVKALAESRYNATEDEKLALGARAWLNDNNHLLSAYREWFKRLGGEGAVTNPTILAVLEEEELARLVAQDISKDRVTELERAASVLSGDSNHVTPYEFKVKSITRLFPILDAIYIYTVDRKSSLKAELLAYVNSKA